MTNKKPILRRFFDWISGESHRQSLRETEQKLFNGYVEVCKLAKRYVDSPDLLEIEFPEVWKHYSLSGKYQPANTPLVKQIYDKFCFDVAIELYIFKKVTVANLDEKWKKHGLVKLREGSL